jgi:hypothetical protein
VSDFEPGNNINKGTANYISSDILILPFHTLNIVPKKKFKTALKIFGSGFYHPLHLTENMSFRKLLVPVIVYV